MKRVFMKVLLVIVLLSSLQSDDGKKEKTSQELTTIIPYAVYINYGDKSAKKDGKIYGLYANIGTLDYLVELNYIKLNFTYKDDTTSDLKQDEVTMIYHKYWDSYSLKIGANINSTTDEDLQNGMTLILGASQWQWYGYDKLTYGMDYYNSYYGDGKDLDYISAKVSVHQFTPYVNYSQVINNSSRNIISFNANFEKIDAYTDEKYYESYELRDTVYYNNAYLELGLLVGEMRTGVIDGGMIIYNSKDLLTNSYSAKFGYYLNPQTNLNLSYRNTTYDEYDEDEDTKRDVISAMISYKF